MTAAAAGLYLSLIPACAGAGVLGVAAWRRRESGALARVAEWAGLACLVLVLTTWGLRWRVAGHLPIFGTYESALSLGAAVLVGALVGRRLAGPISLWPVACAIAAALLAHGSRYDATAFPLTISERSWVVEAHALLAWAAFGCLAVNAALALALLLGRGTPAPPLERLLSRSLSLGFALHTAMLASGSFYEFLLFGTAWSFDPIESLGFVAWIAYGSLLHQHLLAGWERRRLAAWSLGLFVLLTISYRGIVYFPSWSTYHIFDMDLRMHVAPGGPAPSGGGG